MAKALQKLQDGSYSKTAAEKLDYSLYDTLVLATATLLHRMFLTPLGQAGKLLSDTNMVLAGLLPQGQNLLVRAIKFFYVTNTAMATADVQFFYDMIKNTTITFTVPGKENMGQWPLQEIIGSCSMIALTPTVAGDNIPVNQPRFHGIYPLNIPIRIGATQSFEITIQHHIAANAALDGNKIMIALAGKLIRMS